MYTILFCFFFFDFLNNITWDITKTIDKEQSNRNTLKRNIKKIEANTEYISMKQKTRKTNKKIGSERNIYMLRIVLFVSTTTMEMIDSYRISKYWQYNFNFYSDRKTHTSYSRLDFIFGFNQKIHYYET